MRRTNLCAEPAETLDALNGDPSDWHDFKNGSSMSLQPGQYVASCNVTERGSAEARIQFWDEVHHLQLGEVYGVAIGVNVIRIAPQTASDSCLFSVCGCRATDFIIERADTYATAVGGLPGLLHQGHGSILTSRPVVGCENRESMAGPALRKQGQHLECDTGICHHSEERLPLGIHPTQWHILHPGSEVRMHDDAAQPAQLMGLHTSGAVGYAAHGEWGVRHGHRQRRSKGYCWHHGGCRYQDHSDGHVRRRSGRMADIAGGGSARLRSRHRPLLDLALGLGVAA